MQTKVQEPLQLEKCFLSDLYLISTACGEGGETDSLAPCHPHAFFKKVMLLGLFFFFFFTFTELSINDKQINLKNICLSQLRAEIKLPVPKNQGVTDTKLYHS